MSAHRHHDSYGTVSRHQTSEGAVVYRRCHCGALQVALHRPGRRPTMISESRHATNPVLAGDITVEQGRRPLTRAIDPALAPKV